MSSPKGATWGVVLAAGRASRLGFPKALATLDGKTLLTHVADALREGGCDDLLVVVAAPWGERIQNHESFRTFATNIAPERGMLSSLQTALAALPSETAAAVVALVDHPFVARHTIRALLATHAATGAALVRPRHDGRRGHPYVLGAAAFRAVAQADASTTAREVFSTFSHVVDVDVDDPGIHRDLDTVDDLAAAGVTTPAREVR